MGREDRRFYPMPVEAIGPPEYGIDANTIKVKRVDLSIARASPFRVEIAGSVLWAVAASSLAALVNVYIGDAMLSGDPLPYQSGMFIRGIRFSRIYLTNLAQAGEWIQLLTADEGPDNIQIENPAASYASVTLAPWSNNINTFTDVSVAAASAAEVLAANPARFKAYIQSDPGNAGNIKIGDSNVAVARGVVLTPGGIFTIESTEAIYCYNPAGAAQIVCVMETA